MQRSDDVFLPPRKQSVVTYGRRSRDAAAAASHRTVEELNGAGPMVNAPAKNGGNDGKLNIRHLKSSKLAF
jgi:hypothetical protein